MAKKMARPRKGPGRLSASQTESLPERLLDAAWAVFNREGFGNARMEQIAKEAGASTKTLYARFPNKGEMLKAVANRLIERSLAAHQAATAVDARQIEPRLFLTSLGRQIMTGVSGEGAGLIQIALSEARRFPEIAREYTDVVTRGRGIFRKALEQWRDDGLLPKLGDPELASVLCLSMLSDGARVRTALGLPMSQKEIDQFVPYAVDVFLRGCGYEASLQTGSPR